MSTSRKLPIADSDTLQTIRPSFVARLAMVSLRASWVAEELGSAYPVLLALKRALDPAGVMNPGALIA